MTNETEERARRLGWDGCLNARDLGGYPTEAGQETVWGAVVRSDSLATLTAAGQAALVAYGVRTIIDLRRPEEIEAEPNPFAAPGEHGIAYHNISLIDPVGPAEPPFSSLAETYLWYLDSSQHQVGRIMTAIAEAPVGGVLVHCAGGKDRTGLVSALLLELAGVPRETIAADYALTGECLRPREEKWLQSASDATERAERERILTLYAPLAEVMQATLAGLDERFGGVEGYLTQAGVTPDDVGRLRRRLAPEAVAAASA